MAFALAGAVAAYLTVRPGVAAGAIDFDILDRASRALANAYIANRHSH